MLKMLFIQVYKKIYKYAGCLFVGLSLLALSACSSIENSSADKRHSSGAREIAFTQTLPPHGNYTMQARVLDKTICVVSKACLVADHLSLIDPHTDDPYAQSRTLLVYPRSLAEFKRGGVYLFWFHNGRYLKSQLISDK